MVGNARSEVRDYDPFKLVVALGLLIIIVLLLMAGTAEPQREALPETGPEEAIPADMGALLPPIHAPALDEGAGATVEPLAGDVRPGEVLAVAARARGLA